MGQSTWGSSSSNLCFVLASFARNHGGQGYACCNEEGRHEGRHEGNEEACDEEERHRQGQNGKSHGLAWFQSQDSRWVEGLRPYEKQERQDREQEELGKGQEEQMDRSSQGSPRCIEDQGLLPMRGQDRPGQGAPGKDSCSLQVKGRRSCVWNLVRGACHVLIFSAH